MTGEQHTDFRTRRHDFQAVSGGGIAQVDGLLGPANHLAGFQPMEDPGEVGVAGDLGRHNHRYGNSETSDVSAEDAAAGGNGNRVKVVITT